MKTFVKIYGPPILETIKALEKISLDMPEVCIMNTPLWMTIQGMGDQTSGGDSSSRLPLSINAVRKFFGVDDIPQERCESIISTSSESLGEYDFYFEWFKSPSLDQIKSLIEKIDEAVKPLGSRYTLTTK